MPRIAKHAKILVRFTIKLQSMFKNIRLGNVKNMSALVIARCDVSQNAVLGNRFHVTEVPATYYSHNQLAYRFSGKRTVFELTNYILYAHSHTSTLPVWSNPFNQLGYLRGLRTELKTNSKQLLPLLTRYSGLSSLSVLVIGILTASMLLLVFSFTINFLWLSVDIHDKRD